MNDQITKEELLEYFDSLKNDIKDFRERTNNTKDRLVPMVDNLTFVMLFDNIDRYASEILDLLNSVEEE